MVSSNKKMLSDNNLVEDLMIEIIVRLPVKSLLRFKCVAKSWYALITDSSFISKQLEWSNSILKNRHPKLLICQWHYPDPPPSISLISNREQPHVVQDLELPFPKKDLEWISIYGPCNGIFFLSGRYKRNVRCTVLWNPSTKWVKAIPTAPLQPNGIIYYYKFGFGFDPITNDYKIVRFSFPRLPFLKGKDEKLVVEVYNLSIDSWRIIDVDVPIFEYYYPSSGCYFNWAYHWLTVDLHTTDKFILNFDFSKEVFGIIRGPPLVIAAPHPKAFLTVVDKSLVCVSSYYLNHKYCVDIWVMNEYGIETSWTKKFEIEPFPKLSHVLGFWGDNEMLVDDDTDQLILHDLQNQQRQRFQIYFPRGRMMDYVESLVPKLG